jgi:uncharacterized protein (TIGR00369 family)
MKRSTAEQDKLEAAIADLFEHRVRFNEVLGLRVLSLVPPMMRMDMRPDLVGHFLHGRLHGGVICTALDSLGGLALMVAIGEKHAAETADQVMHRFEKLGTIDLRVDFLRPGVGRHFVAHAEVTRLGGRVASTQMKLSNDDGVTIATGAAVYVIS